MKILVVIDAATLSDPAKLSRILGVKGGPGSGNFGHAGRPGEVGGSAPKGATAAGKVDFPTEQDLIDAHWAQNWGKSSASGKWKVTTQDGRQWFVKQPSLRFYIEGFEEIPSEMAAYLLGESLGLPVVPVDFIVPDSAVLEDKLTDDGQAAFLIYPWLEDTTTYSVASLVVGGRAVLSHADAVRFSLFDFLIKNADRHGANLIFSGDGDPLLIDHGLAFNQNDYAAKPFYWHDPIGEPVTAETLAWLEDGFAKAKRDASPRVYSRIDYAWQRFKEIRKAFNVINKLGEPNTWAYLKERLVYGD